MKALPDGIAKWVPVPLVALGTDGFGRSETREALRDFFEVDAKHVAWATLSTLYRKGEVRRDVLDRAREHLGIDPNKMNPMHA
jgi:pyruvate dehydrogenase E1 component